MHSCVKLSDKELQKFSKPNVTWMCSFKGCNDYIDELLQSDSDHDIGCCSDMIAIAAACMLNTFIYSIQCAINYYHAYSCIASFNSRVKFALIVSSIVR